MSHAYNQFRRALKRELAGSPDAAEMHRLTIETDRAAEVCFWSTGSTTPEQCARALNHYLFGTGYDSYPMPEQLARLLHLGLQGCGDGS